MKYEVKQTSFGAGPHQYTIYKYGAMIKRFYDKSEACRYVQQCLNDDRNFDVEGRNE